ncbi:MULTISPECIES: hypothetical protein [unclassified Rathayibacter]|uniref:hypothetical protein n=1 Tax=unclassified Rathayibacter TaxID=2609250 RepID=UPI00188AA3A2|nr:MULTISPECIES: hypothetical protein [unclassified Rathayibacter]MBF4463450.1 hypothetical protein [Rathayibacter sp. VKM Ac-2879]MBF4504827.1 hypothetical protein [Rathayibacter sp. VKM Ac-2878]
MSAADERRAWSLALGADPLLTPTARFVLVYLGHVAEYGRAVSSVPAIAKALGLSSFAIEGGVRELIAKGVIARRGLGTRGRREYRILGKGEA